MDVGHLDTNGTPPQGGFWWHKMSPGKYRSYAITIATVEDVDGKLQEELVKWLKKQDHAYAVIEHNKMGVRHLHAQVWYEEGKEKGTLSKALKRKIEQYAPLSKPHIAIKIKICYNDDWLTEYMSKEIIELLIDNVADNTDQYYPSQEEQDKVMAKCHAADTRFHKMKCDFEEWWDKPPEVGIGLHDVAKFMADMMFRTKTYPVIVDKKNRVNNTTSLYMYITGKINIREFMTEEQYQTYINSLEMTHMDH